MQGLIQVRTCNGIARFSQALGPLTLVGFQGNTRFPLQQESIHDTDYAGLLLARAYAVTEHKRLVLVLLVMLGSLPIISYLVGVNASAFVGHA
jgi:hypothetical protein